MQSSEFDTLPFQEQAHLVLALHALFPSLSRAMRSKVEMYRSITQRLLLSFDLSYYTNEDEYDAFCELLGLLGWMWRCCLEGNHVGFIWKCSFVVVRRNGMWDGVDGPP